MDNEIKVVAFDMDGTLTDSIKEWLYFFKTNLKKFKINPDTTTIKNLFGKHYKEIVRGLVPREKYKQIIRVFEKEREEKLLLKKIKLFPFSLNTLKRLKTKNIKIAIITGNCQEVTDFFINKFNLNKIIDYCVCAEQVKKGKPHPEMILKVLRYFHIKRGEMIYVGDTRYDIEMCKRIGIKVGVVLTGVLNKKNAEILEPDFIFKDVRGVLKMN